MLIGIRKARFLFIRLPQFLNIFIFFVQTVFLNYICLQSLYCPEKSKHVLKAI